MINWRSSSSERETAEDNSCSPEAWCLGRMYVQSFTGHLNGWVEVHWSTGISGYMAAGSPQLTTPGRDLAGQSGNCVSVAGLSIGFGDSSRMMGWPRTSGWLSDCSSGFMNSNSMKCMTLRFQHVGIWPG